MIEQTYPGLRYLELFARRERPGWTCWGNEVMSGPTTTDGWRHATRSERRRLLSHPQEVSP